MGTAPAKICVHDIFIEDDIKNEVSVLPPDITALKAETAHGVYRDPELMCNILKIVYAVKPSDVMKLIDDGKTIGDILTHVKDMTITRLKNKDLIPTE